MLFVLGMLMIKQLFIIWMLVVKQFYMIQMFPRTSPVFHLMDDSNNKEENPKHLKSVLKGTVHKPIDFQNDEEKIILQHLKQLFWFMCY